MSRYTSFPIYILVGLLLIWIEFRARESNIKNGLKIMLSALVLSIPLTMANGFYQGTKWRAMNNYHRYMVETSNINQDKLSSANIPPLYYVNCITGEKVLQCINFLQEHRYNVFHKPTYGVAPILYEEHLGQVNNDVLQLLPHTFQFAPDHIRVITPAETPNYKDKIANLYLDIDGNIYPLFINRYEFSPILQWLTQFDKDKSVSGRGISFVYPQNLTPGIHHVKIKALTVDGKFYIVDPDITFEI
ncbi:hypothetical protein FACS1894199_14040 [Bacteroidia bacterium]|nr:hypothetical protein FACS1894199_14040 [Bacteroidia bacterium]